MTYSPKEFYERQRAVHGKKVQTIYKMLSWLSVLRLLVFLATLVGMYLSFPSWQPAVGVLVAGGILFLLLLSRYTRLKVERGFHKQLVAINDRELRIASGDYHNLPDGMPYQDSQHFYNGDIDLFGRGSFFQYANRTALTEGQDRLAQMMNANNTDAIPARQEAVKELAGLQEWLQSYTALARELKTEEKSASVIHWLQQYQPFLKPLHYYLRVLFPFGTLTLGVLLLFDTIPVAAIGYWLLLGLAITGTYLKKVNTLSVHATKAKNFFKQYGLLLEKIEMHQFRAELLQSLQKDIHHEKEKVSVLLNQFSKVLDALDQRNNLIVAVFGNGLFLYDLWQSRRVEKWISAYGKHAKKWFEVAVEFDALNSLGVFAFNHQDFSFPELVASGKRLSVRNLGHPLIAKDKRICSNLDIANHDFFIVTGANMAGKSTFLRAVALHIVMANMGLPVCAEQSQYRPIKLISSMRTSDSLTDESSYFFSELTRLQFIVEALKEQRYFVILDEILKGTNSTDKAIGSRKFVERLLGLQASGIIATHDLSLTEIAEKQDRVKNYFFDAEIKKDELFFDYKLKAGVCKNMNASFLLRKMGIVT